MENKLLQKPNKFLYFSEDNLDVKVESIDIGLTYIYIVDSQLSTTYHVADFNGSKYDIKNKIMFSRFIELCKKRSIIIRDLLKFHSTCRNEIDVIDDLKIRINCFRRRFSIYTKKKINKTKRMI
jgi:hypothetical protein